MSNDKITLSTLEHLPNMDIEEHLGLVSGSAVVKGSTMNLLKNLLSSLKGGQVTEIDETFEKTRDAALEKMKEEATKIGGNAIINIRFESMRMANGHCEVHAYGSAVKANAY